MVYTYSGITEYRVGKRHAKLTVESQCRLTQAQHWIQENSLAWVLSLYFVPLYLIVNPDHPLKTLCSFSNVFCSPQPEELHTCYSFHLDHSTWPKLTSPLYWHFHMEGFSGPDSTQTNPDPSIICTLGIVYFLSLNTVVIFTSICVLLMSISSTKL